MMSLDDYKVVLYRNQPDGWVAEVPAIRGCYALMATREEALAELERVFAMIAAEYGEKGYPCPRTALRSWVPNSLRAKNRWCI
jgi:predicted RNase H-like HicB family nuclease